MLILECSNPGHHAVTLTGVGLLLPDNRQLVYPQQEGSMPLPHRLDAGANVTHWMPSREIAAELRRIGFSGATRLVAFYRDATGECHKSKTLIVDAQ